MHVFLSPLVLFLLFILNVNANSCSRFQSYDRYVRGQACQCNHLCQQYRNCCSDYRRQQNPQQGRCGRASGKCQRDIKWAMETGIRQHPNWYRGLSSSSSESDFQLFLHRTRSQSQCPRPCGNSDRPDRPDRPGNCGPATGKCQRDIKWAMETGIRQHPDWYPGLSSSSSERDFQLHLHRTRSQSQCPQPCGGSGQPDRPDRPDRPQGSMRYLYHTTSTEVAGLIVNSKKFLPGSSGWCGGAIYFMGTSKRLPDIKMRPDLRAKGMYQAMVEVRVNMGKMCRVDRNVCNSNKEHVMKYFRENNCDSFEFKNNDWRQAGMEYVLYDTNRIENDSFKIIKPGEGHVK